MAKNMVPLRPAVDNFSISKLDKDLLTFAVLFGCDNQTAYYRFHPEFAGRDGKLNDAGKKACRQFFAYARNKEYIDAYRATLSETGCGQVQELGEISEERKLRAQQILLHQALSIVESGREMEPDDLKTVSDIFKKVGLLKDENGERTEEPRRYLPERCSQCKYKIFVDENIKLGNIEDDGDDVEEAHV